MILASQSPRRRELLKLITDDFIAAAPTCGEQFDPQDDPRTVVSLLAQRKARDVAASHKGEVVIGADTVVTFKNHILGKPSSAENAAQMLRELSGESHTVHTGVCVIFEDGREISFVESTRVEFYPLTDEEIADYIATGEPMDKAGAYAIQGRGALFVKELCGDFYNVVGLPIARLNRILKYKENV